MIIECDAVPKDEPLRQGDIIEFLDKKSLWENLGIVITTDCDIDKAKNSNVYSYCPIINIENYFYHVYLPRKIDLSKILEKAKKIIDSHNKNHGSKGVDINIICSWIMERGIENALNDVNIYSDDFKKTLTFISNYFDNGISNINFFLNYKSILDPNVNKDEFKFNRLKDDFKNYISNLPGDLFYISYINGFDNYGYIVNLRRIGMFYRENITLSNIDDNEMVKLKRVARMVAPFNYRITQKVAQMFSDIGLPKDYEEDCKDVVEMFFNKLRSNV